MSRVLLFLACIFTSLLGRENPFMPTAELNTSVVTTNIIESLPPFERENFKFPSDARELISITLKYKSNDGSIKDKTITIKRSINWQDEFILQKITSPASVQVASDDISVTKTMPKIIVDPEKAIEKAPEINTTKAEPLKEILINPVQNFEALKSFEFKNMVIDVATTEMKFITKDVKFRDFALYGDKRLVIDFKGVSGFATKSLDIKCGVFKDIVFGSHNGFYRAVITLDGSYNYEISQIDDGYLLKISNKK